MVIDMLSAPTWFGQAIRGLAGEAHETLTHSPSAVALRRLSQRIDALAAVLGDRRKGPLGTWLENLRREVRSAAVHLARPSHPLCLWAEMGARSGRRGTGPHRSR